MKKTLIFGSLAVLLFGGGIALYNAGTNLKAAADAITIAFGSIKVSFKGGKMLITVVFKITNPKDTTIYFKSFIGKVYISSKDLGDVTDLTPVTILGNSTTDVTVSSSLTSSLIPGILLNLLSSTTPQVATLKGTMIVDSLSVPINQDFPISAKQTATTPTTKTPATKTTTTTKKTTKAGELIKQGFNALEAKLNQ